MSAKGGRLLLVGGSSSRRVARPGMVMALSAQEDRPGLRYLVACQGSGREVGVVGKIRTGKYRLGFQRQFDGVEFSNLTALGTGLFAGEQAS